jgi:hypothetical protein
MRSLQELYDEPPSSPRQVPQSPLSEEETLVGPVSSHVSPRGSSPSQSADEDDADIDVNVTSLLRASRKRPADLSQFVDMIAREKKFKAEDKSALLRFASVSHHLWLSVHSHNTYTPTPFQKSDAEKSILIFSELIDMKGSICKLNPPDAVYIIPKTVKVPSFGNDTSNLKIVKARIDMLVFRSLMDGEIAGYLVHPIVMTEVNVIRISSTVAYKDNRESFYAVLVLLQRPSTTNPNGTQSPHVSAKDLPTINVQLRRRYTCKLAKHATAVY